MEPHCIGNQPERIAAQPGFELHGPNQHLESPGESIFPSGYLSHNQAPEPDTAEEATEHDGETEDGQDTALSLAGSVLLEDFGLGQDTTESVGQPTCGDDETGPEAAQAGPSTPEGEQPVVLVEDNLESDHFTFFVNIGKDKTLGDIFGVLSRRISTWANKHVEEQLRPSFHQLHPDNTDLVIVVESDKGPQWIWEKSLAGWAPDAKLSDLAETTKQQLDDPEWRSIRAMVILKGTNFVSAVRMARQPLYRPEKMSEIDVLDPSE